MSGYCITYQTEEGLIRRTVVQAETKQEAHEIASKELEESTVLYAQEEDYYLDAFL
ncbi:hypothetical protein [Virgibacillus sediminis]|uniref:Uncharacterized protein n=1 Tax=Virgibacillus sediminis TaxID=202260 RepID=A0ABV7A253_9BACI